MISIRRIHAADIMNKNFVILKLQNNLDPILIFNLKIFLKAWLGGDPNLLTYDGLTYTFNGNGEYILSKAVDGSFEIQAHTRIITSVQNSAIKGTIYTGFAM